MKKALIVFTFMLIATAFYSCTGTGYVSTGTTYGTYGFGSYGGYGGYYGGYGGYGYRATVYPRINRGYYGGGYRRFR